MSSQSPYAAFYRPDRKTDRSERPARKLFPGNLLPRDRKTMLHDWEYANHVADIVAPVLGETAVWAPYIGATSYAGYNLYHIAREKYDEVRLAEPRERRHKVREAWVDGLDEAMLELGSTLVLPLYLSRKLHHNLEHAVAHARCLPATVTRRARWISMGLALLSIPLLGKPSHQFMQWLMNRTYRPLLEEKNSVKHPLPTVQASVTHHPVPTTFTHPKAFATLFE